jgi:hypothetical protein
MADVVEFCARIREIRATLDFEVSVRGWCYIMEEHGATKADFDTIEKLLVACASPVPCRSTSAPKTKPAPLITSRRLRTKARRNLCRAGLNTSVTMPAIATIQSHSGMTASITVRCGSS